MGSTGYLLLVLGAAVSGCRASTPLETAPSWLQVLVAELERQPVANPPAYLARYLYRGDTVYYLPPRSCDIRSVVYDRHGAVICSADGGLDGKGDGRCPDFFTARREEAVVWRDARGSASPSGG